MDPYTTRTRARIQPGDVARVTLADPFTAAASLAALERTRACQAEAEMAWLLNEHGLQPASISSHVTMLRQAIGASLVRLGERLASTSASGASPATAPVSGMLGPAA